MERTANIDVAAWKTGQTRTRIRKRASVFVSLMIASTIASAMFATWLPLQFSMLTVFLFAGPHNLLEFRYFLTRLPVRFGRSRDFFLLAFSGIFVLTLAYILLPILYYAGVWTGENWLTMLGGWNSLMLLWVAALVWLRGKQRRGRDWNWANWAWPIAFGLGSINWLAPELFSLALVYLHPLIALWFLEQQLRRSRPELLRAYHRFLLVVPLLLIAIAWQLSQTPALADDNGLAWRITQHAGAELLPNISSHLLVSLHVFLEMLHYLVWLLVLPLLTGGKLWDMKSIPLVRHPRGFPRLITAAMILGVFVVAVLWIGFGIDYATTRDVYFAVAIAHVVAEAPFLLRTM